MKLDSRQCCCFRRICGSVFFLGAIFLGGNATLRAATIWNGSTTNFTKNAFADWTQPANQDRLTANVWLTRDTNHGLFNAKTEAAYTHLLSPADTEWAYGNLTNFASLSYSTWEAWFGGSANGGPLSTLGKDAVLHLKSDDIYLAIKFVSWGQGLNSGGGFSYVRSTPNTTLSPPAPPRLTSMTLLGNGSFRFAFTNSPGFIFTVLAATDLALHSSNWTVLGSATDSPPGSYQFTDAGVATNLSRRFYRVRWP